MDTDGAALLEQAGNSIFTVVFAWPPFYTLRSCTCKATVEVRGIIEQFQTTQEWVVLREVIKVEKGMLTMHAYVIGHV